ncbi:unnamed protein product [Musa acuminata subsp. burmannicoides]
MVDFLGGAGSENCLISVLEVCLLSQMEQCGELFWLLLEEHMRTWMIVQSSGR